MATPFDEPDDLMLNQRVNDAMSQLSVPQNAAGAFRKMDDHTYLAMLATLQKNQPQSPVSRFNKPSPPSPQRESILDLLSRFLHPGSQTAPASPKFNQEGVEDEVIQK